jgi:hypothetical protein
MPIPEDILSKAIAQQEVDRLKAVAKREKLDRRRQPYTAYYGTDSATGQVRVKPQGSNGVLGVRSLSNVQPSMGQYGRGFGVGFDAGNVRKPIEDLRPPKTIDVKFVATGVLEGKFCVWIGGDRPTPTQIFQFDHALEEFVGLYMQNTGSKKNQWTCGVKTKIRTEVNLHKIYTLFGDGRTDWSLTDRRCEALQYLGEGFWTGLASPALSIANISTPPFPTVQPPILAGDPSQDLINTADSLSSGIEPPNLLAWNFTGELTETYTVNSRRFYQGVGSSGPIPWGQEFGSYSKELTSQLPSFSAFNGEIKTEDIGSYYHFFVKRWNVGPLEKSLGNTFLAQDGQNLVIPDRATLTLFNGFDPFTFYLPAIAPEYTFHLKTTVAVAPNILKPFEVTNTDAHSVEATGVISFASIIFGQYAFYNTGNSTLFVRPVAAGQPAPLNSDKAYLDASYVTGPTMMIKPDGSEITVIAPPYYGFQSWRSTSAANHPLFRSFQVDFASLPYPPSEFRYNTFLTQRVRLELTEYLPVDTADGVDYTTGQNETKKFIMPYAMRLPEGTTEPQIRGFN